jgi:hypothetical protein
MKCKACHTRNTLPGEEYCGICAWDGEVSFRGGKNTKGTKRAKKGHHAGESKRPYETRNEED